MNNIVNDEFNTYKYRTTFQEVIIIIFRFLLVFTIIFFLAFIFVFTRHNITKGAYNVIKSVNNVVPIVQLKDRYVFLLLGTDMLIDVNRTDTIILAFLSVNSQKIDLLSVPRDMLVTLKDHGEQKINSIYTFEYIKTKSDIKSIKKLCEFIENLIKHEIDYYVKVDLNGFEKIVDLFGGVEIDVEKNMVYDDFKQNLHIRLKKGKQVLDGKRALQYCRFRHDKLGDIGRMKRQQIFIKAMINKAKESQNIIRLPEIVSKAMSFVTTNIDLKILLTLVSTFSKVSDIKITSHTFPGDYDYINDICYFKPNYEKLKELIDIITYETKEVNIN